MSANTVGRPGFRITRTRPIRTPPFSDGSEIRPPCADLRLHPRRKRGRAVAGSEQWVVRATESHRHQLALRDVRPLRAAFRQVPAPSAAPPHSPVGGCRCTRSGILEAPPNRHPRKVRRLGRVWNPTPTDGAGLGDGPEMTSPFVQSRMYRFQPAPTGLHEDNPQTECVILASRLTSRQEGDRGS